MHDHRRQLRRHRQPHDVRRIRHADEHQAAVDRGRNVVAVRGPGADALAFERAGHQGLEGRSRAEQTVGGDDRRHRARSASAETARQRQAFPDRQGHAAPFAERREQRLYRDTCRVLRRVARQATVVAEDIGNADARSRRERRRHLVARLVQRKAEDVEAAGDVRDGRGREGGHRFHRRDHLNV